MNADASIIAVQGHGQNNRSSGGSFGNERNQPSGYGSVPFTSRHDRPDKRIAVPVRVEPKVFFANERTFLSWLNFAIVLGSLALGLLNFGDRTGKIAGAAFTLIAMFVMVYALMLFQWRAERIRQRDAGPYDDRRGPTVLVVVLICAILINFYLRFVYL
ncbi:GTPase regulator Nrf1 [Coemansia spiralis]|uniref:GTPase regulator Nrf1 n=2 Tax=Coemansia TaxID=4863 RepID=A0A9W8G3G2_9FUNG|nr:GTPase regulator Nrf1 [Coemansia umbellata]KAJ2620731.1 GTPase regulator Nrf1 [Coemansia sp. RSA 1358]KAJ2671924.1 GTPase regulator Nrf1 [Coemansia spiralis]